MPVLIISGWLSSRGGTVHGGPHVMRQKSFDGACIVLVVDLGSAYDIAQYAGVELS